MAKMGRPRHPDILTPRQWEVLALLRERLTNEEIAQRLNISLDGAKYHVSQILSKLGVATREEAAALSAGERWRWWAGWPLWAKIAGAATVAAAAGGLAVVAWGAVRTQQSENETAAAPSSECQFSPSVGAGKLSDNQIPTGTDGSGVCWQGVSTAERYSVHLTVVFYADCTSFSGGASLSQEVTSNSDLTRNVNRLELPWPPDAHHTIAKDIILDIGAFDRLGNEIARGGFTVQKEIDYPSMCGTLTSDPPPLLDHYQ